NGRWTWGRARSVGDAAHLHFDRAARHRTLAASFHRLTSIGLRSWNFLAVWDFVRTCSRNGEAFAGVAYRAKCAERGARILPAGASFGSNRRLGDSVGGCRTASANLMED